jgi:hypothetical protein
MPHRTAEAYQIKWQRRTDIGTGTTIQRARGPLPAVRRV